MKKTERELKNKRIELELQEVQLGIKQGEYALKTINTALEVRNEVVDTDIKDGWFFTGTGADSRFTQDQHKGMLQSAYSLYHNNPYGRTIVRGLVKFVFGKGPLVIFDDKSPKVSEAWDEFKRLNKWNLREKEIGTRTFRDGEVFIRKFKNDLHKEQGGDGTIKVRFVRADRIANPTDKQDLPKTLSFGIETEPDDVETPVNYYKIDSDSNLSEIIPAEEIDHLKILSDSDQKRGISVLRVVAKRLKQYDEWVEDRIVLNKIRSAIALVRTVDSSIAKVTQVADSNRSETLSQDRNKQKTPYRGTVITSGKGITYELLSHNINATDVKDDGRAMLLSVGAGVGFPEMMITMDFSNANFSSTLVAQNPFVREIEDWQDFFIPFYQSMVAEVIQNKIDTGFLPSNTETTSEIEFPPMITADLERLAKAYEILFKYQIASKKTWRSVMGIDNDKEQDQIDTEDVLGLGSPLNPNAGVNVGPNAPNQPGGKSPFNLPISPINQFGAEAWEKYGEEIFEAFQEGDWDTIIDIGEKIGLLAETQEDLINDEEGGGSPKGKKKKKKLKKGLEDSDNDDDDDNDNDDEKDKD